MPQNKFWDWFCCRSNAAVEELPHIPVHIASRAKVYPLTVETRSPALTDDSVSIIPTPVSQASAAGVGFLRQAEVPSPADSPSSIKLVVQATPLYLDPELYGRTITSRYDNLTISPRGKLVDLTPPCEGNSDVLPSSKVVHPTPPKAITNPKFSPPKFALHTIPDVSGEEFDEDEIEVTAVSFQTEVPARDRVVSAGFLADVFAPLATNRGELIEAHSARERGETSIIVGAKRLSFCDGEYKSEDLSHVLHPDLELGGLPGAVGGLHG